jgi:putative hydrolase of the HAD superfamily
MIDFSLIKIIPADESHREFSYQVKKAAEGDYITQLWGWDEKVQRDFHTSDWQQKRPSIILYDDKPIGTIYILETNDYIQIGQFFILPEYQNKGIGSHLLKSILIKADQSGKVVKIAYLINNPVVSLYKRNGFEDTEVHDVYCHMERKPKGANLKYKAVIFDLFGTLVDVFSRQEYERVLAEMVSILKAPYDEFYKIWLQTANQRSTGVFRNLEENIEFICRELKISVSDSQLKLARQVRLNFVVRALKPKKDAIKVLSYLKSEGCRTGLISNCSTEPPFLWQDTPFAPLIDVAIFSSTAGLQKPDPRIYHMATEHLSVEPEYCLYIGDGDSHELTGALKVGMHPVLIRNPGENGIDVIRVNAEVEKWDGPVISSLKEVLNLLK